MIKLIFSIMLIFVACQAQDAYTIATDASLAPFISVENGEIVGFEPDFFNAVSAAGSFTYEWDNTPWLEMFEKVKNNQVSFAVSSITINDVRRETYDFSKPYFVSVHKIIAKEGTDIKTAADLKTRKVAVKEGTTGAAATERIFGGPSANILKYAQTGDTYDALANGDVDAVVDDNGLLENYASTHPGYVVIEDNDSFDKELYGYMFPKGSAAKAKVDDAITAAIESGDYATVYMKWFGKAPDTDLLLRAGGLADPYDVFN
jgi:polar amino acid transport system substrate-binding protein